MRWVSDFTLITFLVLLHLSYQKLLYVFELIHGFVPCECVMGLHYHVHSNANTAGFMNLTHVLQLARCEDEAEVDLRENVKGLLEGYFL